MESKNIISAKGEFTLGNDNMDKESHFYPRPATEGMLESDRNYVPNPGNTHIKMSLIGTPYASVSVMSQNESGGGFAIATGSKGEYKGCVKITNGMGVRFQLQTHEANKEIEMPISIKVQYEFLDCP